jgi:hypothetical protein
MASTSTTSPEHFDPFDLRPGSDQRLDWRTTSHEGRMKTSANSDTRSTSQFLFAVHRHAGGIRCYRSLHAVSGIRPLRLYR